MTAIYFVRHGSYVNPDKIVPWRMEGFPLSDQGKNDIKKVGKYFIDKNIRAVYSSPVLRAKQSAEIIGKILNIKLNISSKIEEIFTPLQNKRITYKELLSKGTIPYSERFHIENKGENFKDIFKRVNNLVMGVLIKHENKNVVLVSHGDPIMIYWHTMQNIPITNRDLLDSEDYIQTAGIFKFNFDKFNLLSTEKINLKINGSR